MCLLHLLLAVVWLFVLGKEISTTVIGLTKNDLQMISDVIGDLETTNNNGKGKIEYAEREDISERNKVDTSWAKNNHLFPQNSYTEKLSNYPNYIDFMKSIIKSKTHTKCKEGGYACVSFPKEVHAYLESVGQNYPNRIGTFKTTPAPASTLSSYTGPTKHEISNRLKLSAYFLKFKDPDWWKQWYMHDYRDTDTPVMDLNIVPAYNKRLTGSRVTIALLGEGIMGHKDLANFDKASSYNFCEDKSDPSPDYVNEHRRLVYYSEGNLHAGLIGMKEGNDYCGVGIAPHAKISAYKMRGCYSQETTPKDVEARALSYRAKTVDIFCNTWTVDDEKGDKLIELSPSVEKALQEGTTHGRQIFGSNFVFPSGRNRAYSNCATNGYVNNPYGITIASANQAGKPASYSERCSAVFATAYSGDTGMDGLATVDANKNCAIHFTDTPAGATLACGIIALLLDLSRMASYRDVMHVISLTAEVAPLADNEDTWYRNGAGFWVSNDFGFGLLNAQNFIGLKWNWDKVPSKRICLLKKKLEEPVQFDHTESKVFAIDAGECSKITYLEHVELQFSASYSCRGAIHISLTSPAGTETQILEPRKGDCSKDGFKDWNIMSIQNWGENPKGSWSITVKATELPNVEQPHGHIEDFVLKLHGIKKPSDHLKKVRQYAAFRLPNGKTNEDKML